MREASCAGVLTHTQVGVHKDVGTVRVEDTQKIVTDTWTVTCAQ